MLSGLSLDWAQKSREKSWERGWWDSTPNSVKVPNAPDIGPHLILVINQSLKVVHRSFLSEKKIKQKKASTVLVLLHAFLTFASNVWESNWRKGHQSRRSPLWSVSVDLDIVQEFFLGYFDFPRRKINSQLIASSCGAYCCLIGFQDNTSTVYSGWHEPHLYT